MSGSAPSVADRIRASARKIGFDAVGFGPAAAGPDGGRLLGWLREGLAGEMGYMARDPEIRADPRQFLPGARSVVAVALRHDPGRATAAAPPAAAPQGRAAQGQPDNPLGALRGSIARYARGRDYHRVLESRLKRLRDAVIRAGGPGTEALWAMDHTPVLDRALARAAGIGFFGKNTMLIRPGTGSYFVLGEVLTNLALPPDRPAEGSCGDCVRCLDACPTKAIVAPFRVDARLCISYLTIELRGPIPEALRPAVGTMVFGCDVCQEVCPWNRFARPASAADLRPREVAVEPDLLRLAAMTEGEWRAAFAGSAVLRAGFPGFRRNVAVALGNSGDRAALPGLRALASCGDPLVEEHARWGIHRLDGSNK
jgi:epoxyqueuosine reductase